MPPRIDERYHFLASEEKHKLISAYFKLALKERPNGKDLDIDYMLGVYGYDILTMALLSDSPLSHPIPESFEGTLVGVWRLLNKIWEMRLSAKKTLGCLEKHDTFDENPHKRIADIHSLVKKLGKNFDENEYLGLLELLFPIAPNLVNEIESFLN